MCYDIIVFPKSKILNKGVSYDLDSCVKTGRNRFQDLTVKGNNILKEFDKHCLKYFIFLLFLSNVFNSKVYDLCF